MIAFYIFLVSKVFLLCVQAICVRVCVCVCVCVCVKKNTKKPADERNVIRLTIYQETS